VCSNGEGAKEGAAQAARWCQKAAAQGRALAQFNFGLMHGKGAGVAQDIEKATLLVAQGSRTHIGRHHKVRDVQHAECKAATHKVQAGSVLQQGSAQARVLLYCLNSRLAQKLF
jgi:hypothetical protein